MQHGYDFSFVNVNLNCNFDPFIDPYMFECLNKELDECFRVSEACFFLVRFFITLKVALITSLLIEIKILTIRH